MSLSNNARVTENTNLRFRENARAFGIHVGVQGKDTRAEAAVGEGGSGTSSSGYQYYSLKEARSLKEKCLFPDLIGTEFHFLKNNGNQSYCTNTLLSPLKIML